LAQSRFDDARTVSRNIQFVKNKNNDFARWCYRISSSGKCLWKNMSKNCYYW
jgi:hypothetical protein